ncbi:MAG TPA: cysteine hydrolase [Acidimicrobiales bacterium]|nr:cysteine hydrolase [Acidimicrobiales bacterium]
MNFEDLAYRIDPSLAALVVVDVQVDFCRGPGSSPEQGAAMEKMSINLERLIGTARLVEIPVIFIQTIHDLDSDSLAWRSRHGSLAAYEQELCKPGTEGAEFFRIAPSDGDIVVVKHRYDAFIGTEFESILESLGRRAVIMTGVMTDVCVETTLRHAMCLDYLATIVSDCCESATRERHEVALQRIAQSFGAVASSSEIAAVWNTGSREGIELPLAAEFAR